VQVADTDYADVSIELTLESSGLPVLELGASLLGGDDCPWPEGPERGGAFERPSVVRHGARVELKFHGRKTSCAVAEGRLTLAIRAGSGRTVLSRLDVLRGAPER
jgi:hypothetical protein